MEADGDGRESVFQWRLSSSLQWLGEKKADAQSAAVSSAAAVSINGQKRAPRRALSINRKCRFFP